MEVRLKAPMQTDSECHRRRYADQTRSSILDAAEECFVDRGFAATSMSEIADLAKITKSLIHHHFGSKESLWKEVKRRRLEAYAKAQKDLMEVGDASPEKLRDGIIRYFRFLQDNPEYVRLSAWMNLEEPSLSAPADPELMDKAMKSIKDGQEKGVLRQDVAPWHIIVMFLSLCSQWFEAKHAYDRDAHADPDRAIADEAYLEDMLTIFLDGLKPG